MAVDYHFLDDFFKEESIVIYYKYIFFYLQNICVSIGNISATCILIIEKISANGKHHLLQSVSGVLCFSDDKSEKNLELFLKFYFLKNCQSTFDKFEL